MKKKITIIIALSLVVLRVAAQNCSITLQSGSATTTVCIGSSITDIVYNTGDGATAIVSCTPLPAGVTAAWESGSKVRISGTPSESGTFNYTLTLTGGGGCSITGTITVYDLPQGSLSGNGPLCPGGAPQLTWTSSSGTGPYTIVYKENGGTNRTKTGVVSGTPFTPHTSTITFNTTYTIVSVTDETTSCSRSSGFTGSSATVNVYTLPQGSLSSAGALCGSGTGQLIWTATSGTGPFTVVYNDGTADRTASSVTSGVPFDVFSNPVTSATTYDLVSVTDINCTRTSGFTTGSATITVNALPNSGLTVGGSGSLCTGTGKNITVSSSQNGVRYQLRNDADDSEIGTPVSGTGGNINLPTGILTATTTFNILATRTTTGCFAELNEKETVTVNPLPQGSLSANGSFCGSGTGELTWNATEGTGPYTIVYNDGTSNRTASSVSSGVPFAVFTNPVNITTTYLLVSVTDANCTRSSGFTVSSATITVNPLPQGSLSANGPFCNSGPGQLTWTASAGTAPFTIVYNDGVADRTRAGVLSGVAFNVFSSPVTSSTTYTIVSVSDANCTRSSGFTAGSASITINPLPDAGLTLGGSGAVCSGTGTNITVSNSQTGVRYQLRNDADNSNIGSPVNGTGAVINLPTGNLTSARTFNVQAEYISSGCSVEMNELETVSVNPLPQGGITSNGPFCASGAGQLTWTATAGTGPFTIVYNDGTADRTATGVISGVPFSVFSTPVTSTTAYTIVSVTDINCTRNIGFTGSAATITVHPLPQGSLSANGPFCDSGAGRLTWTASSGTGPYTVVYNDGTGNRTRSGVSSGVPFDVFTTPVTATTGYTLVSVTDANCTRSSGFTGPAATITINPSPAAITGSLSVCQGLTTILADATPGGNWTSLNTGVATVDASGTVSGVAGGTAVIRYTLPSTCFAAATVTVNPTPAVTTVATANVCTGTSTNISLTASVPSSFAWTVGAVTGGVTGASAGSGNSISQSLTNPSASAVGTVQYIVTPTSTAGSCTGLPYTITVSVNPLPRLTGASQSLTVCAGSAATINLLGLLPGTTSTITYEINNNPQTPVTGVVSNASGIASFSTVSLGYVNNGQLLRITGVTTTSYTPSCYQGFVQDLALSVDPASNGGSVTAVPAICSGQTPADLNLTGVTGYVVKWQKSATAGFTSPIDIPFPTSPLTGLAIGPLTSGTYFRAAVKSGVCPEAFSSPALVTVNSLPAPVISGPAAVNVGATGQVYTTEAGMSSYAWSLSPGGTITAGSGTSSITVNWNSYGNQYVRVNYVNATGCQAASPANLAVQVNARPVAVGVTILGEPRSKLTLTGTFLYTDLENDPSAPALTSYQWYSSAAPDGSGAVPIPPATGASYLVRDDDLGRYIGFSVIPAASSGATPGDMATTAVWVGPVDNDPPKANSVSIIGSLSVNSVLTGTYTYSDREGDIEQSSLYQWYSSSLPAGPFTAIAGATSTTHLVAEDEQGKYFRFSVTPRAATGRSPGAEVVVASSGRVNSRPYATNIKVTGFPAIDSTLTGSWSFNDIDGDGPGASTFRWLRNGTDPIPGATGTTYKATAADEGKTLLFEVTPVAAAGLTQGTAATGAPTAPVIDASPNLPSAQELCIQGNRRAGATLTGKYHYEFYKSEAGSKYRWLRNGVAIPGATGTSYTLTAADIAKGVDVAFEVTPVSSNYIPKTGLPVVSSPLSRILLDKPAYSVADPPFRLVTNVPGGFFSGKGVMGENFDPGIADTIGSPHKITYQVTVTNTVTVCPQQAYDSIYVFPIDPYFTGLDSVYCHYTKPDTIRVVNLPAGASKFRFTSSDSAYFDMGRPDSTSVILYPSRCTKSSTVTLRLSFTYKGIRFDKPVARFRIVYLMPATLDPDTTVFCSNDTKRYFLKPEPRKVTGELGTFSYPISADGYFVPADTSGNLYLTYLYIDDESKCFTTDSVMVTIHEAPKPSFEPLSTCVENIGRDITRFTNKTPSAGLVTGWDWKFYDGGGYGASTLKDPGYAFKVGGQHRVVLTAVTNNGCIASKDSTIDIGIRPVIGFTWKNECFKSLTDADSHIWFFDNSVAPSQIISWKWKFSPVDSVMNDTASYRKLSAGYVPVTYSVETNYKGCGATIMKNIFIRPTISLAKAAYSEDFEGGEKGWTKDYSDVNNWKFGDPERNVIDTAFSGMNSWYTGFQGTAPENSAVISPCFRMDSVSRPMIRIWTWKRFDRDRDGAVLQYQVGDNTAWQPVGTINDDGIVWYNSALINGNPGGKQVGWTAGSGNTKDASWVESRHSLDRLAGEKRDVKFRIAYGSDGTARNNDGMAFDNIWLAERSRGVLLEHFTNSNSSSPNSIIADDLIDAVTLHHPDDIFNINYHTNFPGNDPFYNDNPADASARFLFYGLSKAPFSLTDGGTDPANFASSFNYIGSPVELDTLKILKRSLTDPLFRIDLVVSASGGVLDIKGNITALQKVENMENLTLYLAVTEKKSTNNSLPGGPDFYYVFRKLIPDAAGISLKRSWDKGSAEPIENKTWIMEKIRNMSEIQVVAFIQNNVTKLVYQAEGETVRDVAVAVEKVRDPGPEFSLYPNPASSNLTILFGKPLSSDMEIRIYDFAGNIVKRAEAGSGAAEFIFEDIGLKNGIYLVRITSGGVDYGFKKLIVSGR